MFGDDEPEDGWDRDDAIPELINNLQRRLAARERGLRASEPSAVIAARLRADLSDLAYVLQRLEAESG